MTRAKTGQTVAAVLWGLAFLVYVGYTTLYVDPFLVAWIAGLLNIFLGLAGFMEGVEWLLAYPGDFGILLRYIGTQEVRDIIVGLFVIPAMPLTIASLYADGAKKRYLLLPIFFSPTLGLLALFLHNRPFGDVDESVVDTPEVPQ